MRFERLLDEARRPTPRKGRTLREALGLWRGPALAEFTFDAWRSAANRLEELRLAALEQRIDADLELDRHGDVIGELDALVREHPLRETFRRQQMLALYRSGRQAEALEAYQDARARFVDELGIEPGPELKQLQAEILRHEAGIAAPGVPRAARRRGRRRQGAPRRPSRPGARARRRRGARRAPRPRVRGTRRPPARPRAGLAVRGDDEGLGAAL